MITQNPANTWTAHGLFKPIEPETIMGVISVRKLTGEKIISTLFPINQEGGEVTYAQNVTIAPGIYDCGSAGANAELQVTHGMIEINGLKYDRDSKLCRIVKGDKIRISVTEHACFQIIFE